MKTIQTIQKDAEKHAKTSLNKTERCAAIHQNVNEFLAERQKEKPFSLDPCKEGDGGCPCSTPTSGTTAKVDLVVLIDTSGSMGQKGAAISAVADAAIEEAMKKCPTDLRVEWLGLRNPFPGTKFTQSHRAYLAGLNLSPAPVLFSIDQSEEGADSSADIAQYFDWREGACRAIFYISDEPLDLGAPQNAADDAATANAIAVCNANNVTVFTHLVQGGHHTDPATIANYTDLATQTNGKETIGGLGDEAQYRDLLQDVICNACGGCKEVEWPDIHPCISVTWGDGKCDSLETNDLEVLSISVCNCYSNVTFRDFEIGYLWVSDKNGKPVATLPDGTNSVEALPPGPICFGDIGPCKDGEASCVTREFVLSACSAKQGEYQLRIGGICYHVCKDYLTDACFKLELCKS